MTGSDLEAWERSDRLIRRAADTWTDSSMLPAHYRDKDGSPLIGDVLLGCGVLLDLGLNPRLCLPETYVVKGRLGLMAGLQRDLAGRAGYVVDLVAATDEEATVSILRPDEADAMRTDPAVDRRHYVTVTLEEAKRAGWTNRNPNYQTMPARMLTARACTLAISLYAPSVLHGIIAATPRPLDEALDPPEAGS